MNTQELYKRYVELCMRSLGKNSRVQSMLGNKGVTDSCILNGFSIGYADGSVAELIDGQKSLQDHLERVGVLSKGKEVLKGCVVIPISDAVGDIVNLVGCSPSPNAKQRFIFLNPEGVFNAERLRLEAEIVLTEDPIHALLLILHGVANTTFVFGDDAKYVKFSRDYGVRTVTFVFEGRARLFQDLRTEGIEVRRMDVDEDGLRSGDFDPNMFETGRVGDRETSIADDSVQEIEGGFLFRFPLLNYRVLGNFAEHTMHMRVNIKAFTDEDTFVDAIDLVKHRSRQSFILLRPALLVEN